MEPFCCLCGNTKAADLGQVIGICLDADACHARQAERRNTVRLAGYGQFFATRSRAQEIIRDRLGAISGDDAIVLDWTGVEAVTGAFASELAAWLLRTGRKATSEGMNDEVRETYETAVRRLEA